ncbi:MAG: helix-turn-helix domain-containing protein [Gordonia sp. (in: high G+C Gram-positive bacteria)]
MSTARKGRPRIVDQRRAGATPSEEILDAAAELFAASGFAKTSTRAIAEAVGIRQASLYHHFKTKNDILDELLTSTVEPPLSFAQALAGVDASPSSRMYAMSWFDTHQLLSSKWNIGVLLQLPEARDPQFGRFYEMHTDLDRCYRRFAGDVLDAVGGVDPVRAEVLARLPFHLAETVIALRLDDAEWVSSVGTETVAHEVSVGTLRTLGVVDGLDVAVARGKALIASLG